MINRFRQRRGQKTNKYTYIPPKSVKDEEIAVYRKLALVSVLVIGFAISLYLWGIPLVIGLGKVWDQFGSNPKETVQTEQPQSTSLISPRLNPLSSVINTLDDFVISGNAPAGYDVAIYINDEKQVTVLADSSGNFEIKDLKLAEGDSTVYAKTVRKEEASEPSNIQIVTYDITPPKIDLLQPQNGAVISEAKTQVIGTTEPQAKITVNDLQVIVNATTGDFSREIFLQEGDNLIKIVSTDKAGNTTTIEFHVTHEGGSAADQNTEEIG